MTNRLLSVASFVLALSALGVSIFRSEKPEPKTVKYEPPEEPALSYDEELEGKVSALEWVVSALSRRLETVETSMTRYPTAPQGENIQDVPIPGDVGQRIAALQKDVDALFAAGVFDTEHGRERAKDVFRELQGEIATERFRAREEAREQANRERFQAFVRQAGLTSVQQQRVEGILGGETERRQALMAELQSGSRDRREVFQELRELRAQTDSAVREALPGDEYEQYREMRRAEGGGRGSGGGRGGGRGEGVRQGGGARQGGEARQGGGARERSVPADGRRRRPEGR